MIFACWATELLLNLFDAMGVHVNEMLPIDRCGVFVMLMAFTFTKVWLGITFE